MKRQTLLFSAIMIVLLMVMYLPQMMRPGGINFGIIQDITNVYGFYPWDIFTTREIRAGFFPLWNPHNALGEPHLANMQSAVFYPLTWIKVIANMNHVALDLLLVLRLFLAGLFMFWFLEELRLNFWGKAFGAASFATTGYFTRYVYMSHLNVEILLPLILLCFGRLAREPNKKWFILSTLSVWLAIVGGFPEAAFYAILFGVIWYFYCAYRRGGWPTAPTVAGALALGVVLGLPQLLPFIEYLANAWTYHVPGIGMGHLEGKYFVSLVLPWFFGTNDVSPLVPFLVPYIGVAPAVFAIVGAAQSDRKGLFFLIAAIFIIGIIYGIYPFILIGKIYPFSVTLNFKYAVPIFAFSISALAGMGLQEAIDKPAARKVLIAVGAIAALIIFAYAANHFGFFKPYFKLGSIRWTLAGIVVLMIVFMLTVARGGRYFYLPILLLIFSLIYPSSGNSPRYNADASSKAPEFHNASGRFASEYDSLNPDLNLIWNANDIRYYNPMYLKNYVNLFAKANGLKSPEEIAQNFVDHTFLQPDRDKLTDPLWAKMGLSTWFGEQPGSMDLLPDLIRKADWKTEKEGMIGRGKIQSDSPANLPVLFSHAPSLVKLQVDVSPERPFLKFKPTLDPRAIGKSDGVVFVVMTNLDGVRTLYTKFIQPGKEPNLEATLDLTFWVGKKIELIFTTTPGPRGDKTNDFSAWGVPSLIGSDHGKWVKKTNNTYYQPVQIARFDSLLYVSSESLRIAPEPIVYRLKSQSFIVSTFSHNIGRLTTSSICFPGWKAYDFIEQKIQPEEGFQSVSSIGLVRFIYRPVPFAIGLWAFITSVLFSLSIFLRKSAIDNK